METERYASRPEPSLTASVIIITSCMLPAILWGLYVFLDVRRQSEPTGCRRLGLRIQSHLADQHSEKYSGSDNDERNSARAWRVKSLWIYPVKSCRGVEVNKGAVIGTGMKHDRQYCFAQLYSKSTVSPNSPKEEKASPKWMFLTQRLKPTMALIKTEVWIPDPSSPAYSRKNPNVQSEGVLVIKFPKLKKISGVWAPLIGPLISVFGTAEYSVQIPLDPTPNQIKRNGYITEQMEIWDDSPKSLKVASTESSDPWIQELQRYLEMENHLALFRVSKEDTREVYRNAPRKEEIGYQSTVGFQDAYPLHILNLASVHDIGKKLDRGAPPLGAMNFRPNIVITGGEPYAEDSWKRVMIGKYEYYVSCRTTRCLLPNVNPATGESSRSEPNRTLRMYRRIDKGVPKHACLGMHMVPASAESEIEVGNEVEILETGEHFHIM